MSETEDEIKSLITHPSQATRVPMRSGAGTGTTGLNWLLGDHLGSTTITADASGNKAAELRYKAWGETRYSYGTTTTRRQYTGQVSEMTTIGLCFYGARFYDPALSRFASADSIIPGAGQVQAWDRYAAMGNNPVKYIDPTGHAQACADGDEGGGCGNDITSGLLNYSRGTMICDLIERLYRKKKV